MGCGVSDGALGTFALDVPNRVPPPVHLERFDRFRWMGSDEHLQLVADGLDRARKIELLTPSMARLLAPVDDRSYQAGLMGSNQEGLFKV